MGAYLNVPAEVMVSEGEGVAQVLMGFYRPSLRFKGCPYRTGGRKFASLWAATNRAAGPQSEIRRCLLLLQVGFGLSMLQAVYVAAH